MKLVLAIQVKHNLTAQELADAQQLAVDAASRALIAYPGREGRYVSEATPTTVEK